MKRLLKTIRESLQQFIDEEQLDEERITNKEAADFINRQENFVGSHTYGGRFRRAWANVCSLFLWRTTPSIPSRQ